MAIREGAGNVPQQAFQQWNDPQGNKLIALNRDGTIDCAGVNTGGLGDPIPVNNEYAVTNGLSGAMQTIRVPYSITADDILRGYAYVQVTWPYEWPDLNETITFTVCNPDQTDGTDFAPGCVYNRSRTGIWCILNLTAAAVLVQGQSDNTDQTAGLEYSFTPDLDGIYSITLVATGIAPQSVFPGALLNCDVAYTDNAGPQYLDAVVQLSDSLQPAQILSPIYVKGGDPITVSSSYVTFAVSGSVLPTSWYIPGTASGTIAYGATITQASTGATATYYGIFSLGGNPGNMVYGPVTGTDNGTVWHSGAATFTPNSYPSQATGFYGPGGGVATQCVTLAQGPEQNIPTGSDIVMYLGPHVTGIPDEPSGHVAVPGTPPDATHAWVDNVNGGVLIPTSNAVRFTFPYNLHIRIVQFPNNSTIYTPGMATYLNFISIHD